jgi:hypothetical protein
MNIPNDMVDSSCNQNCDYSRDMNRGMGSPFLRHQICTSSEVCILGKEILRLFAQGIGNIDHMLVHKLHCLVMRMLLAILAI